MDTVSTKDPRLVAWTEKKQLWLAFDHARSKNALDLDLSDALAHAIEQSDSPTTVITGKNGAFTSGGNHLVLAELAELAQKDTQKAVSIIRSGGNLIEDLLVTPTTTVAFIDGACAGAGLGIMMACDYRIATPRSRFVTAYSNLGLPSDFGTYQLLKLRIGKKKARKLMDESPVLSAKEALDLGLVDKIVDEVRRKTVKKFLKDPPIRLHRDDIPEDFSARLDKEAEHFVRALKDSKVAQKIERAAKKARR